MRLFKGMQKYWQLGKWKKESWEDSGSQSL